MPNLPSSPDAVSGPRVVYLIRDTYPSDSYEWDTLEGARAEAKRWDVQYAPRAPHRVIEVTITERDVTVDCTCHPYEYGSGAPLSTCPTHNPPCLNYRQHGLTCLRGAGHEGDCGGHERGCPGGFDCKCPNAVASGP